MRPLFKLFKDERGATAVEYGLILAMVFLAMVGAVTMLSGSNAGMWNYVSTKVQGS
ncbi:MAG: Flp family type IVb pilin [Sphingomonas sp.]